MTAFLIMLLNSKSYTVCKLLQYNITQGRGRGVVFFKILPKRVVLIQWNYFTWLTYQVHYHKDWSLHVVPLFFGPSIVCFVTWPCGLLWDAMNDSNLHNLLNIFPSHTVQFNPVLGKCPYERYVIIIINLRWFWMLISSIHRDFIFLFDKWCETPKRLCQHHKECITCNQAFFQIFLWTRGRKTTEIGIYV